MAFVFEVDWFERMRKYNVLNKAAFRAGKSRLFTNGQEQEQAGMFLEDHKYS